MHKQKSFTSATIKGLDILVNDFIGKQTYDSRTIERNVVFFSSYFANSLYTTTVVYDEVDQSN